MSIGVFQIVKNEVMWVGPWLARIIPFIDEVVIFDSSTDGTTDILKSFRKRFPRKVKLFTEQDCDDLGDDYVTLWNECMACVSSDWGLFLHPDMFIENPEQLLKIKDADGIAMSYNVRSFAGDPDGEWKEIEGRAEKWKALYRIHNPDLGAHYFGHYGARHEDVYFSEITGDEHINWKEDFKKYPYEVKDSGLNVLHFSDVRPYPRRLGRMVQCLVAQGRTPEDAKIQALVHPRVTLKDGLKLSFHPFASLAIKKEIAEVQELSRGCPA